MVKSDPYRANTKVWRSKAARRLREAAGGPRSMHQAVSTVAAELLCGVTAPPTDLDAVARKVNVACFLGDDIAGSGELRSGDAGLIIVYSNYLSKARQRFTIAHEIAHAYFESNWVDLSQSSKEIEQLCDMIAAEILMPTPAVSERIKGGLSIEMILEVARSFRVSMSAAAIRCSELKRATVFEANERSVTWGCGFVRKGRVRPASR